MAGTTQRKKPIKIKCINCDRELGLRNFYSSNKVEYKNAFHGKAPFCTNCLKLAIFKDGIVDKEQFIDVLVKLDKPFIPQLYAQLNLNPTENFIGEYIGKLNLRPKWKNLKYEDSLQFEETPELKKVEKKKKEEIVFTEEDNKTREDCIKLLGYDPFKDETESEKPHLYNTLINYLDEATLDDSFKIPAVIQIVKTFNQINNIDKAITECTKDVENIVNNISAIKSLSDSKKGLLSVILNVAKDNGISVNHSNNKSKGAGTLGGLMKELGEKEINEAEVNLFDIKTSESMQQTANISVRAILDQIALDENDYVEMQKELIEVRRKLELRVDELEEENRLIKIKNKYLEDEIKKLQGSDS